VKRYELPSFTFRREREPRWVELETMIDQVERQGLGSLDAEELHRLPTLYRHALSSLAVARAISLDANLLRYLESLAARAYVAVYSSREGMLRLAWGFVARTFPAEVRAAGWPVAIATGVFWLAVAAGFALTVDDPERFYAYVSEGMAGGRTPAATCQALEAPLYGEGDVGGALSAFAGSLFAHNARIGLSCFALGFAAGVPVVLLLFSNGLSLGAMAAVYAGCDLSMPFWAWVMPHGVTELGALLLCGGAGLVVAQGLLLPGRLRRRDAVAAAGRRAARIALGAALMFFLAALIEGFFRQLVHDEATRLSVASASAVLWAFYFARAGR